MSEINELPNGWVCFSLGDITTKNTKKATPEQLPDARFVGMDCIEANSLRPHKYYSFKDFKSSGNCFENNQVLYGRMRPYLNKVFLASFKGVCSGEFIVLNCLEAFSPDYLQYILHGREFVRFANSKTSGDRPRITFEEIATFPIKLPPLPEQHRIVSKIEELFSSLDKGVESLKTARQQLKVYRQAVLKWAFEGRLTNENVVHGELPKGWKAKKLVDIVDKIADGPFGSNLKSIDYMDKGVRVIRLENIGNLEFKNEYKSFVTTEKYETIKKHTVAGGDIIFSSFISESIRTVILPDYIIQAINKADCFLVRTSETKINRKYLVYYFSTKAMYNQLVGEIHGATRPRINTTQLKGTQIPFAPLAKQQAIVSEIESRLSVCDKIEESITQSLLQAEALRQSILKKAFEGKLVPQDPADEPASVLLERIKAEREKNVVRKVAVKKQKNNMAWERR